MSAKTYAGLNRLAPSLNSKALSAEGFAIVPFKDSEDDSIYRSRFGWPSNGSGPWMTARRVIDVKHPSTDGFGNVTAYTIVGGYYGLALSDYKLHATLRVSLANRTYTTYDWYYDLYIIDYKYIWKSASSSYKYLCNRYSMRSALFHEGASCSLGFTEKQVRQCYLDGDMTTAYSIMQRVIANRHVDVRETLTDDVDYIGTQSSRYVYLRQLDLAPPEAVYLEYREDAELYLLTDILPGPWARGLETAYIEAGKNLPQSATNVAANVLEAAELLASLLTGRFLADLPKTAREAWLAYRYAYTTTKLDIREFQDVFSRLDILARSNIVPTYGSYVRDGITYRVGYEVDTAQIVPTDVSSTLRKFGLELNALNVWDMIPFSFVVDWFLPVSDIIEYFQDIGACRYEPKDLWWSLTTVEDGYEIYVRLPGRKLSTMPYLQLSKAGSKTVALRIADAVALFAP